MKQTTHATSAVFDLTDVHEGRAVTRESDRVRIQDTMALVPRNAESLLEVGCGNGSLLNAIRIPKAFGTDLGWRGLPHCQRPVCRSSVTSLPFDDNSVDVVLCAEVLEHLHDYELEEAAAELVRVARRTVIVTVPYEEQLRFSSHRCKQCGRIFHLHGHRHSFGPEDLKPLFTSAGNIVVRTSWVTRRFNPQLLWLRTRVFDLWKYTRYTVCPGCGNQEIDNHEGKLLYRLFNGLNEMIHPKKNLPNWLLMQINLKKGENG